MFLKKQFLNKKTKCRVDQKFSRQNPWVEKKNLEKKNQKVSIFFFCLTECHYNDSQDILSFTRSRKTCGTKFTGPP
jgi:hypothetical protein